MSERKEPFTQVSQRTVYTCDGCGEDRVVKPRECHVCGGDFCGTCKKKGAWADSMGGDDYGDYASFFCERCWKIGAEARATVEEMTQTYDDDTSTLVDNWFAEAREVAKKLQDPDKEIK